MQRKPRQATSKASSSLVTRLHLPFICIVFTLVMLLWGLVLFWQQWHMKHFFQFQRVKVVMNAKHLEAAEIAAIVDKHINGGFFSLNAKQLHQALLANAWVAEVSFRRWWPSTLEVDVVEQQPLARWGEDQLITATGQRFRPAASTIPTELTVLNGSDEEVDKVLQQFIQTKKLLAVLPINISALNLNPRHSWQMVLNGKLAVALGQQEISNKLKRFIVLYQTIILPNKDIALSVDLRYPNGAAIQWAHPSLHLGSKA